MIGVVGVGSLLLLTMLGLDVAVELVLPVVFEVAVVALLASVGLVLHVASLMIVAVTDCRELLLAELTLIGSLTSMDPLVNLEVSALVEQLVALDHLTRLLVDSDDLSADEGLLRLFGDTSAAGPSCAPSVLPLGSELEVVHLLLDLAHCLDIVVFGWDLRVFVTRAVPKLW